MFLVAIRSKGETNRMAEAFEDLVQLGVFKKKKLQAGSKFRTVIKKKCNPKLNKTLIILTMVRKNNLVNKEILRRKI